MYKQNNFLLGILGFIGFVIAFNTFIMDALSTAHNLTWLWNLSQSLGLDKFASTLQARLETWLQVYGFFVFLAVLAVLVYRR
ncbi:hypothetical protein A6770_36950 [Nostoc minutum NIES-26]|uniref:Uncharacterized protein n=1 Tax=Nostoc minutum NIES-26 TaxID=1844469 RepID=A0A367RYW6_9NOSO|nr:hypothetical protein A6770_36950 [Nostoc minutum NIES-26]